MNITSMAVLNNDMTLDPRIDLPDFGIKSEKEAAAASSTMVLTPHMFDLDFEMLQAPAVTQTVVAPMTPEGSRTPPATAAAPPPPPPPPSSRRPSPPPDKDDGDENDDDDSARRRKRRRTSSTTAKDEARRARCLERNRVAASKCREKKKQWVHELEASKLELEKHHANLQREYGGLLDESTRIKTSLMAHAACHDHNIDSWIEAEATRFVKRSQPGTTVSAPPQPGEFAPLGNENFSLSLPLSLYFSLALSLSLSLSLTRAAQQQPVPSSIDDAQQPPSTVSYGFLSESLFPDDDFPHDDDFFDDEDYKLLS
ncbi:hypothetical protein XA68_11740 [Ophiocordyceps unilateralis]|uniref:BZIP domain-containing protein n=1 Tax=Ophiocordyceps unilateralis TaxID=268505 RepID=A0A2A9PG41_OPHUN|nr:hypothetical protein XA68_11740 [Ophiocordyceps unilateralis]